MKTLVRRGTLLLSLGILGLSSALAGAPRPNILLILADDWGWGDLSCRDHPYLKTPNLDKLAGQGTDFLQFTVASGVCSPSRAAILTGKFPSHFGIHGHFATVESHAKRGMPDWLDPETTLLPRLLQEAGYRTAHYGKWHLTNIMVKDAPLPSAYGYDDYGAYNCSGPQMPVHDDARRAIEFIEKSHAEGKPFFINLWVHEPHTPHYPKPEFMKRFEHLDEPDQIYAAVLAHADARVGEVLATLERLGLGNDTLVIFSSDNGPENTGPADRRQMDDESTGPGFASFASVGVTGGHRGRKRSLLQGGVGVPFIVRWPGKVPAGRVDDITAVTAVDLLPTFCALAGVKLPEDYVPDGVDQTEALRGTSSSTREKPIFWEWRSASTRGDNWPVAAVWQGNSKLLLGKQDSRTEMFRLPADRLEKENLSESEVQEVERLRGLIDAWREDLPSEPADRCFSKARGR